MAIVSRKKLLLVLILNIVCQANKEIKLIEFEKLSKLYPDFES